MKLKRKKKLQLIIQLNTSTCYTSTYMNEYQLKCLPQVQQEKQQNKSDFKKRRIREKPTKQSATSYNHKLKVKIIHICSR